MVSKDSVCPVCYDDFSLIFHVTPEVVFPSGASLFNDLEITTLMEFFIIKVGSIQCFQGAAYFTAKLICSWHRLQALFVTLFAYDAVPIPVGVWKVGLICKRPHCICKILLDFVKPIW